MYYGNSFYKIKCITIIQKKEKWKYLMVFNVFTLYVKCIYQEVENDKLKMLIVDSRVTTKKEAKWYR